MSRSEEIIKATPRFRLGQLVATPGALDALARAGQAPAEFIARHVRGDWGDVCAEDAKLNDEAVAHEADPDRQGRVLSAYRTKVGDRIWVITEADRSSTCTLLPADY
jgi:hypothetical protein